MIQEPPEGQEPAESRRPAERKQPVAPKSHGWLYRLTNFVLPVREAGSTLAEAGRTGSAIGGLVRTLIQRVRSVNADQDDGPALPVPTPSDPDYGRLMFNAKASWCVAIAPLIGSLWLVYLWFALPAPSFLTLLNLSLGALVLAVAGVHMGLNASRLVHSVREGRWIALREAVLTPRYWSVW